MPFPCDINNKYRKGVVLCVPLKRLVAITLTSFILLSTTIVANAETSQNIIQNSESKLEQNAELINQKETEQKMILTELQDMQSGLHEIENEMSKNKEELSSDGTEN